MTKFYLVFGSWMLDTGSWIQDQANLKRGGGEQKKDEVGFSACKVGARVRVRARQSGCILYTELYQVLVRFLWSMYR